MSRPMSAASLVCLAAILLAAPARADRLHKGSEVVLIGIGGHTGEFFYPGGPYRLESGEVGGHVAYDHFLSDQWTLGISWDYHAGQLKSDDNNPNGTPLSTTRLTTHSFTVRIGGDRYAFIDDNVALYAGPGLLLTRGRAKSETTVFPPTVGGGSSEGPNSTEVGFNGRLGMYARLNRTAALFGHIGQVLSRSSGKDSTGKLSWWSSTFEGSVGLAFEL